MLIKLFNRNLHFLEDKIVIDIWTLIFIIVMSAFDGLNIVSSIRIQPLWNWIVWQVLSSFKWSSTEDFKILENSSEANIYYNLSFNLPRVIAFVSRRDDVSGYFLIQSNKLFSDDSLNVLANRKKWSINALILHISDMRVFSQTQHKYTHFSSSI